MATITESAQNDLQMRLRRVEGQIRGIIGMLEDGKSCEDVVTQILAARAGIERVAAEVLKCHVTDAMSDGTPEQTRESVLRAISLLMKV